jgi:hypothetical protein
MAPHNKLRGRGGAPLPNPHLFGSPVLNLELVRTADDLRAIIMVGDVTRNVADARTGTLLDSFLFVPAYSGLLFCVGLMLSRATARSGRFSRLAGESGDIYRHWRNSLRAFRRQTEMPCES